MKSGKAVVLVSGGLDSCVTAAIANLNYELAFLHLNYGQRTEKRELRAFKEIADFFGVKDRLLVDAAFFNQIGGSSLTDMNMEVSEANIESDQIPSTYVPFRNANILSIATSYAEVSGATKIFIGAVEEDSSGYPDCRLNFFQAFNQVIRMGTKPETNIEIMTPIIDLKKWEIVKKGLELKAPLDKTWSCYKSEDKACGVCDSCALRLRGFRIAGSDDPIPYHQRPDY
ncbi:MAG: 7-cyano-7-deazaguanine synthase QueC [Calditrichaceae bacterium]